MPKKDRRKEVPWESDERACPRCHLRGRVVTKKECYHDGYAGWSWFRCLDCSTWWSEIVPDADKE